MSEEFVKVGQVGDFPSGSKKKVKVGEEDVLVANVAGKIHAISNTCTHRGGSLDEGEIEGTVVTCPLHGGRFDVTTGKVLAPPPRKDGSCFEVRIQGTDLFLKRKSAWAGRQPSLLDTTPSFVARSLRGLSNTFS